MKGVKIWIVLQMYELCIPLLKCLFQVLDCFFSSPCSRSNLRHAQWGSGMPSSSPRARLASLTERS